MRCTHPSYAINLGINPETEKMKIKFLGLRVDQSSKHQLERKYGKETILTLPCGKCLACKLNKAKEWAVRCTLESLDHEESWFLTLTYDQEHLPKDGKLHREHLKGFLKALYNRGFHFRYFGCGEYGSKTKRPHYHVILFGLKLDDLSPSGRGLFSSKTIQTCWPYGFNMIAEVNYSTCNYVAQYTTKKVFGDKSDEFLCMSNRPGIGYNWCKKHIGSILKYDAVYGAFGSSKTARLPRYFEKIADMLDHQLLTAMKEKRLSTSDSMTLNEMLIHGFNHVEDLYEYQEQVNFDKYKQMKVRKDL